MALSNRALGLVVPSGRERIIGYGPFEHTMDTPESAVSHGDYLLGERFSTVDLYLGAHIGFGMGIEKRPALER